MTLPKEIEMDEHGLEFDEYCGPVELTPREYEEYMEFARQLAETE